MDSQTYESLIPTLQDKVMGMLVNEFKRTPKQECEDVVQNALVYAFRKLETFASESGLLAYLYDSAKKLMFARIRLDKERRETLSGLPASFFMGKTENDPYRLLDWKIDLERAIRRATNDVVLQSAMWDNIVVGWTVEELTLRLAPTRSPKGWQEVLVRTRRDVKREMRKGGYKGIK